LLKLGVADEVVFRVVALTAERLGVGGGVFADSEL
jgi:hypothetical protein